VPVAGLDAAAPALPRGAAFSPAFLACVKPGADMPARAAQLGTHLRAKNKREDMAQALRKMRCVCLALGLCFMRVFCDRSADAGPPRSWLPSSAALLVKTRRRVPRARSELHAACAPGRRRNAPRARRGPLPPPGRARVAHSDACRPRHVSPPLRGHRSAS
jgi:hypothetical protein